MNKQDYELLVRECCNRLPYGVMVELNGIYGKLKDIDITHYYNDTNEVQEIKAYTNFFQPNEPIDIENFKLVLRPMSDITDEECEEIFKLAKVDKQNSLNYVKINDVSGVRFFTEEGFWIDDLKNIFNYLHSRHLDYNGLIEKDIAINSYKAGEFGKYF